MNKNISKLGIICILLMVFFMAGGSLFAQKYNKVDPVKYLQLPTEKPVFTTADVFVQVDQSAARDGISLGLGKLSGKKDSSGSVSLDELVNKVFADQVEKYSTWSLFDGDISLAEGESFFKVVVVCTPDDGARPMGDPMKNNKGLYTFNFRTAAKMKVFDEKEKLIIEKDFGTIAGSGHSKTWPKGATSMISVSEEDVPKHPYEVACIDGALDHAKRVLYGLYGLKEFSVPLGVYTIKSQKESKNIFKAYKEIIKNKKKILLTDSQEKKMQECVDYWEGILSSVKDAEIWAVHYNLSVGYAWLLNDAKSIEHIAKVKEINSERFDHILNKSGSFNHKDLAVLVAYNTAEPFANYYAKGINNYPNIPALMDMDVYTMSHVMSINQMLANVLDAPVSLPIFPYDPANTGMKKCEGAISKNDQLVMEFSYALKKGEMSALNVKSGKDSYVGKIKETVTITDKADLHPAEIRKLFYKIDNSKVGGSYGLTPELEFFLNGYSYKTSNVFPMFSVEGQKSAFTELETDGLLKAMFTDSDFIKTMEVSGGEWFKNDFMIGDSAHVTITSEFTHIKTEAKDLDADGIPGKYEVTYSMKNTAPSIYAKVKSKFGEETSKEQKRQWKAQSRMAPIVQKLLLDGIFANGGTIKNNKTGEANGDITLTKIYDVSSKVDNKGNWTEITIGDFSVTRTIKY
jgi:hypothetical protein